MAPPRAAGESNPTIYVDASSYYFVQAYLKTPGQCRLDPPPKTPLETAEARECLAEAMEAKKAVDLPGGAGGWFEWPEDPASESAFYGCNPADHEGRMNDFEAGVWYAALWYDRLKLDRDPSESFLPHSIDPHLVERVREELQQAGDEPISDWQGEWHRFDEAKAIVLGAELACFGRWIESWGDCHPNSAQPHPTPFNIDPGLKQDCEALDRECDQRAARTRVGRYDLYSFLARAVDFGVKVALSPRLAECR